MLNSQFLDQLLKSGQSLIQNNEKPTEQANEPADGLGNLMSGGLGKLTSGFGGGALTGGVIGLLLGNKKARKLGSELLTYGGLAALGVIAYKAYKNHSNRANHNNHNNPDVADQQDKVLIASPKTVDRVEGGQIEQHSQAILKALVAASKADGHIDAQEKELIQLEMGKITNDNELKQWIKNELNKPLDPADVARAASTPEIAAEMYIASVMMIDEENFMERSYLNELARLLNLDPELKNEFEAQVRGIKSEQPTSIR